MVLSFAIFKGNCCPKNILYELCHKKPREMFTDATRAMAVGSGEKDNKKALAQRKRQVVLFSCLFVILFVFFW